MASADLAHWWNALPIGASIATLMGLLGFVSACIFLAYLAKIRSDTKRLALLSPKDRAIIEDKYLSRYKLSLENADEGEKVELVKQEMTLRSRRQLSLSALSAAVFLVCVIILAFAPHPKSGGPQRTPADQLVIDYMREIQNLRGDFEAKATNWPVQVRQEGIRLANLIGKIDEGQLNPSRKLLQHEYKGWALLLVARTFIDPKKPEEQRKQQIKYASQAIGEFNLALKRADEVTQRFKNGDPDAAPVYEWFTDKGENLYHAQYLKAVAIAVVARAEGNRTKEEVRAVLAEIPPAYLDKFPVTNNPDLTWAVATAPASR